MVHYLKPETLNDVLSATTIYYYTYLIAQCYVPLLKERGIIVFAADPTGISITLS